MTQQETRASDILAQDAPSPETKVYEVVVLKRGPHAKPGKSCGLDNIPQKARSGVRFTGKL